MSRRTLLRVLLTPIVIVLFGATTMAAGNADNQPDELAWPGASFVCAEGTLAFAGNDSTQVWLSASIQPCAGTSASVLETARWGVAQYHTEGAVIFEHQIGSFESATGPTVIEASVHMLRWGLLQAACLITEPEVRVACAEVTTDWAGATHVNPIPITDPRVSVRVAVLPNEDADPECGACV